MANDGQRVPAQIYPPQIGLSPHDTRYDDHSNLRSSETLPAHPQHVQPFSNMGDPTLTLEGPGFPSSSADQTLHGAVGTESQVSGLALQQQSSRLAHHSFQQYPVQQSITSYGYQHNAVQPNTGLIPRRPNDSPTTASTIPPLSTPMPLFLPATPHRNSYRSSGTDGRERSRVPPNEPVNSEEARLQRGQRAFPTGEYPSDAPRTIASVSSDVIDSTRNQDMSGSPPGPDAYHVAPGSVLTSSSLTSLSHPVESPMVLAPASHAPHFQENASSAASPALQRPVTAPSAQAGGRAGDHGGMVFGGATAGVMHEQPLSEEKPHGIVVPTGRPTYGFRSGLRSAPLTPKDQSAVTDMNSGQQTRPSSSQQRHVTYPEESYAALHRSMVPTSSVDVETLSPPSSMESRVQANQGTTGPTRHHSHSRSFPDPTWPRPSPHSYQPYPRPTPHSSITESSGVSHWRQNSPRIVAASRLRERSSSSSTASPFMASTEQASGGDPYPHQPPPPYSLTQPEGETFHRSGNFVPGSSPSSSFLASEPALSQRSMTATSSFPQRPTIPSASPASFYTEASNRPGSSSRLAQGSGLPVGSYDRVQSIDRSRSQAMPYSDQTTSMFRGHVASSDFVMAQNNPAFGQPLGSHPHGQPSLPQSLSQGYNHALPPTHGAILPSKPGSNNLPSERVGHPEVQSTSTQAYKPNFPSGNTHSMAGDSLPDFASRQSEFGTSADAEAMPQGNGQAPTSTTTTTKKKDPRPHKCMQCGKAFPRPSALSTHMSVHSGEKPYPCPVVGCNKTFAVRSNARRHLKTHGIRLKTRDRSKRQRQPSLSKRVQTTSEEDDDDEGSDLEDAAESRPLHEQIQGTASGGIIMQQYVPPTAGTTSSATHPNVTSTRLFAAPQDRGLGPALHRGHGTDPTSEPLGFSAALTMLEFHQPHNQPIHVASVEASRSKGKGKATPSQPANQLAGHDDLVAAGVEISTIKKGTSAAKRRWQVETSGGVRLRKSRDAAKENRRQRGSGQFDINNSGLVPANDSDNFDPEGEDNDADVDEKEPTEGQGPSGATAQVAELEESALRMLCPEPKRPSTPRIPQLDRAALDKLIAPPLAWQEYQNRLKQQEDAGSMLGLDEKIALAHRQVASISDSALADAVPSLDSALPSHTNTPPFASTGSHDFVMHNIYSMPAGTASHRPLIPATAKAQEEEVHNSNAPVSTLFGVSQVVDRGVPVPSTFHTSSMRTSASGPPASIQAYEAVNEEEPVIHGESIRAPPSLAPVGSKPRPNSFSSTSSVGASEGAEAAFSATMNGPSGTTTQSTGLPTESYGYWRADGQWVPRSMAYFRNVEQLRSVPPFTLQGLDEVNLNVPFHPVHTRNHQYVADQAQDERDSLAKDIALYPYHPDAWINRSTLPGSALTTRDWSGMSMNVGREVALAT